MPLLDLLTPLLHLIDPPPITLTNAHPHYKLLLCNHRQLDYRVHRHALCTTWYMVCVYLCAHTAHERVRVTMQHNGTSFYGNTTFRQFLWTTSMRGVCVCVCALCVRALCVHAPMKFVCAYTYMCVCVCVLGKCTLGP